METETFVGLDIHRTVVVATALDERGHRIDQSQFGPTDAELIAYLGRLPGTKRVVLEACAMWEHYYDAAISTGADVTLSHPYKTRLIAEASLKSDKVDSEALATLRRLNGIPSSYAPPVETRALRRLVRDRLFYRQEETRVMNHIYAVMMARGVPYEPGVLTGRRKRETLRSLQILEVNRGLDILTSLDATMKTADAAIHARFLQSREAQLLASIPGIGELTATILAAYICPIERFATLDRLASYCGLCPTNHQSAMTSYQGSLKTDCNPLLRWVLIEVGWSHRRYAKSSYVSKVGRRIGRRRGAKRGSVASAHALLRVVFAILKRGTPYTPHAPERPSRVIVTATSD